MSPKVTRKTYWYSIDGHGDDLGIEFESSHLEIDRWLAEDCAEDYHGEHDGWECSWPMTFCIREVEGGPIVARFEVYRETVPQFTARLIP